MKTVYTQESSWKVAANASGYVLHAGEASELDLYRKAASKKGSSFSDSLSLSLSLSLSQFICTATGLLLLQWAEKGCCHWFTHATPPGLEEEQRLRLERRRFHHGLPSVDENNSRSTAISNNRNFAILFPSMVVSKLTRENKLKKKDNHRLVS